MTAADRSGARPAGGAVADPPGGVTPITWKPTPAIVIAAAGAIVLAAAGLALSRPDIVVLAAPLALWSIMALGTSRRSRAPENGAVSLVAKPDGEGGALVTEITLATGTEVADVLVEQMERRRRRVVVPGDTTLVARSRTAHSGPVDAVQVRGRAVAVEGALVGAHPFEGVAPRSVAPPTRNLPDLPLAPRLTGLHGAHEGSRPGQGGDFRDIHPFAPGDELRRVDWRATARAARRPGDLLVRRTNTLSDSSVVIAMDVADDLGEVVATWGTRDRVRSGTTSLDHAREAARSLATAAIGSGDRVAYHVLARRGRSLRAGTGSRHLARLVAAIAATGQSGDDSRYRRTPPVPHGSIVAVCSTFFDGAAAELAVMWRATGHRVVAVDTLPDLDRTRLSPQQALALRIVLAERDEVFRELATTGIDVVRWDEDPAIALSAAARIRVGGRR